jgi:hypothetical protein
MLIAFRITPEQWLVEEHFGKLLAFFDEQPKATDELAFFTSDTHSLLPLEEMEKRFLRLTEIIPRVRERGYRAGINVLSTMGHHEENLEGSITEPWQRLVDPDGRACRGSFCPLGSELLAYVDGVYTHAARTDADFIWVDDDVRLWGHKPIVASCFCDRCVEHFSQQMKRRYTWESLVKALDGEPTDERLTLRRQWLKQNRELIRSLLATAARAAHRVKPSLSLGFMTGDRLYEGYDFPGWAEAIAGPEGTAVRWRPGEGFYSDECYTGLTDKSHVIGRQVAQLPDTVDIIQSEIENFPYHMLRKSVRTTVVEAGVYMAAGTTGTAFNVLTQHGDPLDEYRPLLRQVTQCRPFYEAMRKELGRSPALGVWPAWNRDVFIINGAEGSWFDSRDIWQTLSNPYVLGEIGIPLCYDRRGATLTALSGNTPWVFTRVELEEMFRGGVLMDVASLRALERMDAAKWAGVRVVETFSEDAIEVLTDHPLNGTYAGWMRNCRQSFWTVDAYRLEPTMPGVETLARLTNYLGHDLGPCMTAYENELGGRVVVMGYYPWKLIHNMCKSSQLKAVCAWLSRDTQPVTVESFARVMVWARQGTRGQMAVVLYNATLDAQETLSLRVRTTATCFELVAMDGSVSEVTGELCTEQGGAVRLVLHDLAPWSLYLLRVV